MFRTRKTRFAALWLALIAFSSTHAAEVYTPLEFTDKSLNQRSDIRSTLQKIRVNKTNFTGATSAVDLTDLQVHFFNEIAEILKSASSSNLPPVTSSALAQCQEHQKFSQQTLERLMKAFVSQPACTQVSQQIVNAFHNEFANSCYAIYRPEVLIHALTGTLIDIEQVKTLEGAINFAARPLSMLDVPGNLLSTDLVNKLRLIYVKINTPQLTKNIESQISANTRVLQGLNQFASCFNMNNGEMMSAKSSIQTLNDELLVAQIDLNKINEEGRQQALLDQQKILNQKRFRANLPYPSLSDKERELLSIYMGAVFWRMRGGGILSLGSTSKARYYFNRIPLEHIALLNGGTNAKQFGTLTHERITRGWGEFMDMGTTPGDEDRYHDVVMMSQRGLYQIELVASELSKRGFDNSNVIVGGLQMGVCYYYGLARLVNTTLGRPMPAPYNSPYIEGFTAWGENCAGGSISLGLAKSLLAGSSKKF